MTTQATPPTTAAAAPNILLCTLGASWAVIPEVLGWLAPGVVDLYAHHPQRAQLDALRALLNGKIPAPRQTGALPDDPSLATEHIDKLVNELAAAGRGLVMVMGKGGVGKSTIAANLSAYLAYQMGLSTTLIDWDPHGSSSRSNHTALISQVL